MGSSDRRPPLPVIPSRWVRKLELRASGGRKVIQIKNTYTVGGNLSYCVLYYIHGPASS
jgi:hypothetical protein